MSRILLNAATVVSLVLWVATVVAWARSYGQSDDLWSRRPTTERGVISSGGSLLFYHRAVTGSYRNAPPFGWRFFAHGYQAGIADVTPLYT